MIAAWIAAALLVGGAFFILLAAVGLYRFPDIFSRMHAATKASSFGVVWMALAVVVWFPGFQVTLQAVLIVFFIYLTTPLSAHLIARACYLLDIAMTENPLVDELEGKYDLANGRLKGADHEAHRRKRVHLKRSGANRHPGRKPSQSRGKP